MLSYRHSFHAGNYADVLKHTVLTLIIESLKQKDKGFLYLDTHAGIGKYHLHNPQAEKTGEYLTGIQRLWERNDIPAELTTYIDLIKQINQPNRLTNYAGSPCLAVNLLRAQDRALLSELHPADYPILRKEFARDSRVTVKRVNGYQNLKAALPPAERRGFILIDPSYELKEDYRLVVDSLIEGYKRFATGCYAIWYPVVLRKNVKQIINGLVAAKIPNIIQIELAILPDSEQRGMTASGMIVINPPWKLEQQMQKLLPYLVEVLVPEGTGSWSINRIAPE